MSLPPSEIPLGAIRFNSDSSKLEYWNGSAWFQIHTFTPNLAQSGESATGVRAIIHMGYGPANKNTINAMNMATGGTAIDFGNSTVSARQQSSLASRIRALRAGGYSSSYLDTIDFVTISSTGDASDFGDLITANGSSHADTSDSIIGCIAGGQSNTNTIEKIIIQTTGNAVDYGDLTSGRSQLGATSDSHGGLS